MYSTCCKTHMLLVRTCIIEIVYVTTGLLISGQTFIGPGKVCVHHCINSIHLAFSVSIHDFKSLSNEQQPYLEVWENISWMICTKKWTYSWICLNALHKLNAKQCHVRWNEFRITKLNLLLASFGQSKEMYRAQQQSLLVLNLLLDVSSTQ